MNDHDHASPAPVRAAPTTARSRPPSSRRGLAAGVAICAVAIVSGCGGGAAAGQAQAKREAAPVPVVVATVARGDVPIAITGLGSVLAANTVQLRSRVDGQLVRVAFREGDLVEAGAVVAEIDPTEYAARVHQAQGQLARDQAQLRNAQADLERYRGGGDVFTRQQIDSQAALVDQDAGIVEADQGALADAQAQLAWCKITAPLAGRVGLRNVDLGNIVHAADATPLAVITQEQPIGVVFTIREDDVAALMRRMQRQPAPTVEAWNRDRSAKLAEGEVLAVDNQVDPATGTVRVKAQFANEDRALFPNQFVNARLVLDTLKDAVVAPTTALQRGNGRTYVFIVDEDGAAQMRDVEPGPADGGLTAITKGLDAGESVIVDGVDRVRPGAKVKAHRAGERAKDGDGAKGGKAEAEQPAKAGGHAEEDAAKSPRAKAADAGAKDGGAR